MPRSDKWTPRSNPSDQGEHAPRPIIRGAMTQYRRLHTWRRHGLPRLRRSASAAMRTAPARPCLGEPKAANDRGAATPRRRSSRQFQPLPLQNRSPIASKVAPDAVRRRSLSISVQSGPPIRRKGSGRCSRYEDGIEIIRIISARRATRHERQYYERENDRP